jgi:hypothetical protein
VLVELSFVLQVCVGRRGAKTPTVLLSLPINHHGITTEKILLKKEKLLLKTKEHKK